MIAIIIPCYNCADSLSLTLDSIAEAASSSSLIQVIIQDGSNDCRIQDLLSSYQNLPFSVFYFQDSDRGVYDAINKAIARVDSSIEWFFILGAGDRLLLKEDILLSVLHKNDRERKALVSFDVIMPCRMRIYSGRLSKTRLAFSNLCHQGVVYKSSLFREIRYDASFSILADYALHIMNYSDESWIYENLILSEYDDSCGLSKESKDPAFLAVRYSLMRDFLGLRYAIMGLLWYWFVSGVRFLKGTSKNPNRI